MEGNFSRQEFRFDADGIGVSRPPEQDTQDRNYPLLVNVRQIQRGTLRQRPGLNSFLSAPANKTPWHSLRRLNDRFQNDYAYIAGIGTGLSHGKAVMTEIDTGYSGNPLSMLPYRPQQAYNEWMAVADSAKMRKVKYDGTLRTLGIAAPTSEPSAGFYNTVTGSYQYREIDIGNATAGWSNGALGEVPSLVVGGRVSAATGAGGIRAVGIDPNLGLGGPGWYGIHLANLTNITVGSLLVQGAVRILVEEVHPSSPAGAGCVVERVISLTGVTVAAQSYMWIVPSVTMPQIRKHAFLNIGGDYALAMDVLEGPDGKQAILLYIASGSISVGDAITVENSIYGHITNTPIGTVVSQGVEWIGLAASNTHNLTRTGLALDLTTFSAGRAITDDDEMVVSIYLSDVSRVSELKVEADVNDGTFTRDYYTRSVSPDEFIPVTKNQITAQDNRPVERRRKTYDYAYNNPTIKPLLETIGDSWPVDNDPGVDPTEVPESEYTYGPNGEPIDPRGSAASRTSSGSAQWFKVRFKLSDWRRIGESEGKDRRAVNALRLVVITNSGGTITFGFDDWWIVGGFEPDVTDGAPYEYRYRYRDSATGERSNWSPPSRLTAAPHRYQVGIACLGTAITGVDTVDLQRRGGQVNDWRLVASAANAVGSVNFIDAYSDNAALGIGMNPDALEGNTNAQPFTVARGPATLTGCVVSGPLVYHAGAGFNTSLAQGTPVIANGLPALVYRVHSTTVMELYTPCGQSASATVAIPQQFITSQPLPVMFGTLDGWSFALGDTYNPGRLYWFNNNTLGGTQSKYWIDVSDSSEALLNGVVFGGRAYVWTSERIYMVSFSGDGNLFRSDPVQGSVGLYARWAITVGDSVYFLGKSGIYAFDGGQCINITSRDLQALFALEGQDAIGASGIVSPYMPQNATSTLTGGFSELSTLRLAYAHDQFLYFDYRVSGQQYSLVLDRKLGAQGEWGWVSDVYGVPVVFHYADEGEGVRNIIACTSESPTARAAIMGGAAKRDLGATFNCTARTAYLDLGDLRSEKLFGDGFVDIDPGNGSVTPTFRFDNGATSDVGAVVSGASRPTTPPVIDFNVGSGGRYARNVQLELAWSVSGDTINTILYSWGFSVMGRPERTVKRATDYSTLGHWGPKELKGVSLEVDTGGVARDIVIEYTKEDGTVATITKVVTTGQKDIEHLSWDPVTCYEARIRPTDDDRWRFYETAKWHYEPLSDMSSMWGDWQHFGRAVWVQGVEIDGDTNNVAVSTNIQRDFSEVVRTITATHNGRGTKAYSFDPPFIAYMVRTAPSGAFRRMKEIWLWKPESPIGTVWHTQEFELGDPFGFARDFEVEYAAGATVTLKYYVDGTLVHTDATTLVTTGNTETFVRRQVDLPAVKGRLGKVRLECTSGVRVRQNGSTISLKSFGGNQFTSKPVVGSDHGYGAEV